MLLILHLILLHAHQSMVQNSLGTVGVKGALDSWETTFLLVRECVKTIAKSWHIRIQKLAVLYCCIWWKEDCSMLWDTMHVCVWRGIDPYSLWWWWLQLWWRKRRRSTRTKFELFPKQFLFILQLKTVSSCCSNDSWGYPFLTYFTKMQHKCSIILISEACIVSQIKLSSFLHFPHHAIQL